MPYRIASIDIERPTLFKGSVVVSNNSARRKREADKNEQTQDAYVSVVWVTAETSTIAKAFADILCVFPAANGTA